MLNKYYSVDIQHFFFKNYKISFNLFLKFFFFKTQKFLFISLKNFFYQTYFLLPPFLSFYFKNNIIFFILCKNNFIKKNILFYFFYNFKYFLKQINHFFFKTIYVRGINLKINFLDTLNDTLKMKLGYSHLIFLAIPENIIVKLYKKKIILKCFNKIILGNFCSTLFRFRPINIFTGKGFLIKQRKKFKLKEYSKKI